MFEFSFCSKPVFFPLCTLPFYNVFVSTCVKWESHVYNRIWNLTWNVSDFMIFQNKEIKNGKIGRTSARWQYGRSTTSVPIQQQWLESHPQQKCLYGSCGIQVGNYETQWDLRLRRAILKRQACAHVVDLPTMVLATDQEIALPPVDSVIVPAGLSAATSTLWEGAGKTHYLSMPCVTSPWNLVPSVDPGVAHGPALFPLSHDSCPPSTLGKMHLSVHLRQALQFGPTADREMPL